MSLLLLLLLFIMILLPRYRGEFRDTSPPETDLSFGHSSKLIGTLISWLFFIIYSFAQELLPLLLKILKDKYYKTTLTLPLSPSFDRSVPGPRAAPREGVPRLLRGEERRQVEFAADRRVQPLLRQHGSAVCGAPRLHLPELRLPERLHPIRGVGA